ncbi:hypothetical protein EYF80_040570 [Liparis tanakae]|uniref:Uncharacterized protein n=1 Tax=Liparis tanakae TaxID=230148 RepID=A0A4Z2G8S0_9TELE|nr:hypothetical protein EYF80_040570 [Liparis tanakae]
MQSPPHQNHTGINRSQADPVTWTNGAFKKQEILVFVRGVEVIDVLRWEWRCGARIIISRGTEQRSIGEDSTEAGRDPGGTRLDLRSRTMKTTTVRP